jgi:hypothetical protein
MGVELERCPCGRDFDWMEGGSALTGTLLWEEESEAAAREAAERTAEYVQALAEGRRAEWLAANQSWLHGREAHEEIVFVLVARALSSLPPRTVHRCPHCGRLFIRDERDSVLRLCMREYIPGAEVDL